MASPPCSAPPALPVDVLLLVFAHLGDLSLLWATCRGVSHFWRACVDEYFRHGIIQSACVDLHYPDFHTRPGPFNTYVHVPMAFSRLSADGVRAVFQQREYKQFSGLRTHGSVRGWVPFAERYCSETHAPKPRVLTKGTPGANKPSDAAPLWEQAHSCWRNTLSGNDKTTYLSLMRDMVSIGRGDRPPFYLRIADDINDTDLASLEIDCARREISFDWRATFSLFFRELDFVARADKSSSSRKRIYDEDLAAVATRYFLNQNRYNHTVDAVRARQKRLAPWVAKNKHRMSPEVRLMAEHRVQLEKTHLQQFLYRDNLREVEADDVDEIVPARLADDHPDLLFWPWGDEDRFFVPKKRHTCGPHKCVIL